jgi:hypothetical protein
LQKIILPIFVPVKKTRSIAGKITAALLLVLLGSFHAVKVFHRHAGECESKWQAAGEASLQQAHCDVCDFQLAKEAFPQEVALPSTQSSYVLPLQPVLWQAPPSSIGLSYSDRGPPAKA